jgi:hypothetical protein
VFVVGQSHGGLVIIGHSVVHRTTSRSLYRLGRFLLLQQTAIDKNDCPFSAVMTEHSTSTQCRVSADEAFE